MKSLSALPTGPSARVGSSDSLMSQGRHAKEQEGGSADLRRAAEEEREGATVGVVGQGGGGWSRVDLLHGEHGWSGRRRGSTWGLS